MVATSAPAALLSLSDDARRAVRRRAVLCNLGLGAFAITVGAAGDDMLQLYGTQVFGLGPAELGAAIGLLSLTIPLQLAMLPVIERHGKSRVLAIGYAARLVAFLPFLALPALFARSPGLGYAAFVALLLAVNAAHGASFNIAWPALMKDITRPGERGRFFGAVRFWNGATSALFLLGFGFLLDDGIGRGEYQLLVGFGLAYLAWSWWHVRRIPEAPSRLGADRSLASALRVVRADLVRVVRDRRFRRFAGLAALAAFADLPMSIVYGQSEYGVSDQQASLLTAARSLAGLAALLAWGRIVDRAGPSAVLRAGGLAIAALLALLFLVPPGTPGPFLALALAITIVKIGLALAIHTQAYESLGAIGAVVGLAIYSFAVDIVEFSKKALAGWALEAHLYRPFLLLPLAVAIYLAATAHRLERE